MQIIIWDWSCIILRKISKQTVTLQLHLITEVKTLVIYYPVILSSVLIKSLEIYHLLDTISVESTFKVFHTKEEWTMKLLKVTCFDDSVYPIF